MEEKMKGLEILVSEVDTYCNENSIEYLFTAVAEGGKHTLIKHNTVANAILKEAAKIVKTLIKEK
jgi:hypothetical protein